MTYRRITIPGAIAGLDATVKISGEQMERWRSDPAARKELQQYLERGIRTTQQYMLGISYACRVIQIAASPGNTQGIKFCYNGKPQDAATILQRLEADSKRYETSLEALRRLHNELCEMDTSSLLQSIAQDMESARPFEHTIHRSGIGLTISSS